MRTIFAKSVATVMVLVLVCAAVPVGADTIHIDRVPGYFTGSGGEFTVTQTSGDPLGFVVTPGVNITADDFQTFCLEFNEHVSIPGNYDFDVTDAADSGGEPGGDPLSPETKLLYGTFVKNTWDILSGMAGVLPPGYDYAPGPGRQASAGDLQVALWELEDEPTPSRPGAAAYKTWASAVLAGTTEQQRKVLVGKTRVINLTIIGSGGYAQDQLIAFPADTFIVPLPTIFWPGLIMLGGLGVSRFVKRRRAA